MNEVFSTCLQMKCFIVSVGGSFMSDLSKTPSVPLLCFIAVISKEQDWVRLWFDTV